MRPNKCAKFETCTKMDMIRDKDCLEVQAAEAMIDVCRHCTVGETKMRRMDAREGQTKKAK